MSKIVETFSIYALLYFLDIAKYIGYSIKRINEINIEIAPCSAEVFSVCTLSSHKSISNILESLLNEAKQKIRK